MRTAGRTVLSGHCAECVQTWDGSSQCVKCDYPMYVSDNNIFCRLPRSSISDDSNPADKSEAEGSLEPAVPDHQISDPAGMNGNTTAAAAAAADAMAGSD